MLPLTKKEAEEKITLSLRKRELELPGICQVVAYMDVSGSFKSDWESGRVALLAQRVLGVAFKLDDNGVLQLCHFDDRLYKTGEINAEEMENVQQWLSKNVLNHERQLWNGTHFTPIVDSLIHLANTPSDADFDPLDEGPVEELSYNSKKSTGLISSLFKALFSKEEPVAQEPKKQATALKDDIPLLAYIITDGDCQDYPNFKLLSQNCARPVFVNFINTKSMSDTAKEQAKNCDFIDFTFFENLKQLTDEMIFEKLLSKKFINWRKQFD